MKKITNILIFLLILFSHFRMAEINVFLQGFLYALILVLSLIAVYHRLRDNEPIHFNILDVLIICFSSYLILNNIIQENFHSNKRIHDLLFNLSLLPILSIFFKKDRGIINTLFLGFTIAAGVEICIGFCQLFGLIQNSDPKFVLGGLMGNPGAFAGHLAIFSPFLLFAVINHKLFGQSEDLFYALIFCLCSALFLIGISESRGAWISASLGLIYVLNTRFDFIIRLYQIVKTAWAKVVTAFLVFAAILSISFLLYNYKPDSAFGRLFIWKVSKEMVTNQPVFGHGIGSFEEGYGKIQAAYFMNGKGTASEIQTADYVTCAYNEYLEMFIDSGLIGTLMFLLIIGVSLASKRIEQDAPDFNSVSKGILIAFCMLSLVSYPMRLPPNLQLVIAGFFVISRTGNFKSYSILKAGKGIVLIWLLTLSITIYWAGRNLYGSYYLQKGYRQVMNNEFQKGIQDYTKAEPFLHNDGLFQFYFGSALYLKNDVEASLPHLQKAVSLNSDPNAFITLGNAFQKLKRYKEAENAYLVSEGITPSKLYPKYLLAKLYFEMGLYDKALDKAKTIINTKEKVATTAGSEIKAEMNELIKQYTNKKQPLMGIKFK